MKLSTLQRKSDTVLFCVCASVREMNGEKKASICLSKRKRDPSCLRYSGGGKKSFSPNQEKERERKKFFSGAKVKV